MQITDSTLIDDLALRNRAYQVLYALGFTPSTAATLEPGAAAFWVRIAQEVVDGKMETGIHHQIKEKCKPAMLRYITTGKIGDAHETL